ncbi:MAG TPA: M20/M25/M40 family metallo-hydrolase, partial [Ktedonobacterales bacterium]|nr:M20/M25/M40 family metallo-hydrolase [Ktedonobacterales bacterium]
MSIVDANPTVNWDALTDEAVRHLYALLRFDTTNPPGNELAAAMYIRDQLAVEGIESQIVEPAQGRGNIWARLAGNGQHRPLMLLSHLDVVPVERDKWSIDPFGGEINDGFVYGRGAVDMKQIAAIELTLLLHFARQQRDTGEQLGRDLILLAVADE